MSSVRTYVRSEQKNEKHSRFFFFCLLAFSRSHVAIQGRRKRRVLFSLIISRSGALLHWIKRTGWQFSRACFPRERVDARRTVIEFVLGSGSSDCVIVNVISSVQYEFIIVHIEMSPHSRKESGRMNEWMNEEEKRSRWCVERESKNSG